MIGDFNGDLLPDLFGIAASDPNKRMIWVNQNEAGTWSLLELGSNGRPLSPTSSHALADFNGDCVADLLISTVGDTPDVVNYEIWQSQMGAFVPITRLSKIEGIRGAGMPTVADFDGDGNADIMIPVCYPADTCAEESSIRILYNQQQSLCRSIFGGSGCRRDIALCQPDDSFTFPTKVNSTESLDVVIVGDSEFKSVSKRLYWPKSIPGSATVRVGDFNLDRFPDLLVPVDVNGTIRVELWENIPCAPSLCSADAVAAGRRTFHQMASSLTGDLLAMTGAFAAAPFDLDETGRLDLIVLFEGNTSAQYSTGALFNNFFNDAFFLKTLGLGGVCTINCGLSKIPDPKPYGVNRYGATFKYSMTDLGGTPQSGIAVQLSQSSHLPLQTPYTVSGLGRPSNYVDYVYFGVAVAPSTKQTDNNVTSRSWPGIMPNSQVVASPYPSDDVANWVLELYISPSGTTVWIVIAVVSALVVLGAVVGFLHYREKKQDEMEKKEKEHLFSFKAL
eukprot:TRINITY_DN696_c0_g1_i1.p1 TRINITY_DN696_c0_g1~~TRINITY_DN696_c0_g1_i1.p1  ORF type:complete len:505 (+),score=116.30 TRINITY_DN696_c0_g1_i1:852-2366(+)